MSSSLVCSEIASPSTSGESPITFIYIGYDTETENFTVSGALSDSDDIIPIRIKSRCPKREESVHKHLSPNLQQNWNARGKVRFVTEDHPCFKLPNLLAFREEYNIQSNPWNHFVRLLCGCVDLPIIILQNPSNNHLQEYDEANLCPALEWILKALEHDEIGLSLDDVIIMDICSLLSDNDLHRMGRGEETTWDAVEKSYAIAEAILKELKPTVILCCQCITANGWIPPVAQDIARKWEPARNSLAKQLCSSPGDLRSGKTTKIAIVSSEGSFTALMVYGMHPIGSIRNSMVEQLKGAFLDVYVPCRDYYSAQKRERVAMSTTEARREQSRVEMSSMTEKFDQLRLIIEKDKSLGRGSDDEVSQRGVDNAPETSETVSARFEKMVISCGSMEASPTPVKGEDGMYVKDKTPVAPLLRKVTRFSPKQRLCDSIDNNDSTGTLNKDGTTINTPDDGSRRLARVRN